jgi:mRNA interferase YafQ
MKRLRKCGKDLSKLFDLVERLAADRPLEPKHRAHPLVGDWKPKWDCHIEPDWLLVYEVTEKEVLLVRTGSHADLFR